MTDLPTVLLVMFALMVILPLLSVALGRMRND